MVKKISALLEVRKIIALITVILFAILSIMGILEISFIQSVIISVISFYFGKTTSINEKGTEKD